MITFNSKYFMKLLLALMTGASVLIFYELFFSSKKFVEYENIMDKTDTIFGEINKIKRDKGYAFVELLNGTKVGISKSWNYNYKPDYITDFLQPKDSIVKPEFSDTLYVYRNSAKYYFVLGESIRIDTFKDE